MDIGIIDVGMENGYFWPAAVLMVVAASWVLYRYVAPEGWKEWRGAGLVQTFIIALYAEMYGFPLTLYVLTGVLGFDIPIMHMKGHLWSTLLGYGALGNYIEMFAGYAFVFFGLGLLVEGWREVYRARQQGRLATGGLYRLVRHPQYTGIFLALFGQLVHWPTIITLALFPVIVWTYVRLARREERQMAKQFGGAYEAYRERTPSFFPKWGQWRALWNEARVFSDRKDPWQPSSGAPGSGEQARQRRGRSQEQEAGRGRNPHHTTKMEDHDVHLHRKSEAPTSHKNQVSSPPGRPEGKESSPLATNAS